MPDISIAIGLLKKPLESIFTLATGKAKDEIARLKAESHLKTIYQKLNATQKIKTIWDVDRARSLSSFYYPAKIRTKNGTRQQLASLDELPNNAVVLSGTVGQGKSILLRYLLGKEMRSGTRIPLFIELRKVPLAGLDSYLRQMFNELLEINNHPEIFELFAASGKVSFLLDGFDEIDPDRAPDLMTAIEHLATRFPHTRIVVTSRPSSGIETSPMFDVVHIAQLVESDFAGFFSKILSRDRQLAEMITAALLQSNSVRAVASTPLLATLLTIVYRSTQRIPNDFSEFYDQLFQILLVRHDRSKAYSRRRKTKLGDREMQQAFEAFCYKVHTSGKTVIPKVKALEFSKSAIAARELTCHEDDFLDDVIRVTCLVQEEGANIEFLHQSVREFYAA
ncbi:MAG: NACHT domain-containing protein [Proteobacteria bacterium]|nr:NACHT domain-containing protein [Pseudomonadota bacterium]